MKVFKILRHLKVSVLPLAVSCSSYHHQPTGTLPRGNTEVSEEYLPPVGAAFPQTHCSVHCCAMDSLPVLGSRGKR